MSKIYRPFLLTFAAALLLSYESAAQDIEAELRIDPEKLVVHVEGRFLNEASVQTLAFLSDYAGITLPSDRITNVKLTANSWSYDVNVAPMKDPAAAVHISWLTRDKGVVMLADVLPRMRNGSKRSARVKVITPKVGFSYLPVWPVTTTEKRREDDSYWITDAEKAVFLLRFDTGFMLDDPVRSTRLGLSMSGSLQISLTETLNLADEIYQHYRVLFRATREPLVIGLATPATNLLHGRWEADTRGRTITIITSDAAFQSQGVQQLHEQLRHEMFHLWIPEGVNLRGNYDWFYEGFALYQSLKLGVAVNRIRFDDYLDTLSRAYDIDRRLGGKLSLIETSRKRWDGDNNTVIYARGMLVAFLCDLAMLDASKGKRSTDDLVREVYARYSGQAPERDGNDAVISILKNWQEVVPIVENYVTGVQKLDWADLIRTAGLQTETKSGVTNLSVVAKPNGSQRRILDKLGYNNWRKLVSK
jgi:hypothetical protein